MKADIYYVACKAPLTLTATNIPAETLHDDQSFFADGYEYLPYVLRVVVNIPFP